ncbi:MAG: DUF21 domain-containing protein [Candidatus Pacebacteria bacterium]|nr:DUF21 domain-containing protein [Candidatus Paceibacterota bacterium]
MEYLVIIPLVLFSALFSGLTIGFLGLDKTELRRKKKLGDERAIKISQVRENGNLLLVVLLVGNVAVNSIFAVFLGDKFSGVVAVLISTVFIVIFGEILPQAIFYRHALSIGSYFVPLVKFFIFILYPIAWPIAKILDKFLGIEEDTVWSKKEIGEIIKDHEDSIKSDLDSDEEDILLGALTFSDKKVRQIMTPRNVVFMLEENSLLNEELLVKIKKTGFTRLPVYRGKEDNIVGVLNIKSLINLHGGRKVYDIYDRHKILEVSENDTLDNLLNNFIKRKSHIACVLNIHKTFLGIVTMEDVIEEIISKEIVDETDECMDMRELSKNLN